jgi:hypothetical protein
MLVQPLGNTVLAADIDFPAASLFDSCRMSRAGIRCEYLKEISFGLTDAAHERGGNGRRAGTENELRSGRLDRRADSFQVTQQTGGPTHISVSLPGGTVSSAVA